MYENHGKVLPLPLDIIKKIYHKIPPQEELFSWHAEEPNGKKLDPS